MFQLMRNIHLGLGLVFVTMAAIFAVSSLVLIYRDWFPRTVEDAERTITLELETQSSPRLTALELMRAENLKGTINRIEQTDEVLNFRVFRPGEQTEVEYTPATGEAKLKTRRWGVAEMLVQLHVNHGFWHDFAPTSVWSAISLLTSAGLLLLGATGIYLWFVHYEERLIGTILLVLGLGYGLTTLILTRLT